jgi:hypothetical protein
MAESALRPPLRQQTGMLRREAASVAVAAFRGGGPASSRASEYAEILNAPSKTLRPVQRSESQPVVQRVTTSHQGVQTPMPVQFSGPFRSKHVASSTAERDACINTRIAQSSEIVSVNTTASEVAWTQAVNSNASVIGNVATSWITENMNYYETTRIQGGGLNFNHEAKTGDVAILLKFFAIGQPPGWCATLWHIGNS